MNNQTVKFILQINCYKEEQFVDIEKRLYEEHQDFKDTENYFYCKGNKIKRFRTIEENNISKNDVILLLREINT